MNLPQTKRREQQNNSPFSRTIDKYNMEVLLPSCHNIGPPPFVHETDVTSSAPRQISIIHQLILIRRFPSDSASIHSLLLLCLFCTHITMSHVLFTCGSNSMCFSGLQITSRFFFLFSYSKYSDQKNCPCASRNCDIRWNIFVLCTDKHDFP